MRCSGPFTPVYVHTAKCSSCDRRNRNTLQKCAECGEQFCNTCFTRLGSRRFHGPPDIAVFPSTTQGINSMPPVMSASVQASMSTQQSPPVRNISTPSRGRGSTHRTVSSRPSSSATLESPNAPHVGGTATSPVVLDDSPSYRAYSRAMEPASPSSSRTLDESVLTPRRSARTRPYVPSYNEIDSPEPVQARPNIMRPDAAASSSLMSDELSPLNTKYTPVTPPPRPAPGMSVLHASRTSLPDYPTNAVLVQGSKRRLVKRIPPPKGLSAADCKQDLASMTPSEEERVRIEAVRSSGTLETGTPTSFSIYANRLSRRPSSFPTLEECLSQKQASVTASRTPVSSLTNPRSMQRTIASSSQAPTTAISRVQRVQQQPHTPVIVLDDSDDSDEDIRPPNYSRLLGHQPPRVTPGADSNVTPGPQAMRTTPLLSVASERLAEQSPTGNKYLDVLMTARSIEQEPSSITGNSPTIGSVEAANLGRDSATPMEVDSDLQEGADPYTGSIDSAIGDKSSPIYSMPRDNRKEVEDTTDEEAEETVKPPEGIQDAQDDVYSSDRLSRLRPRDSLPTPTYTSRSRRSSKSTTPRPPRTPKKPLEEDENKHKRVGRQTREFNEYLESIPLRKDFYIKKEEDPKLFPNKVDQIPTPEPSLDNDSRGRSQSELPGKSQDNEMNNGKDKIKMEETRDTNYDFTPNKPYPESRVRYEVYGRPNQPPPISPTELYRRRKNDSSQMRSNSTRAAAVGSTTNTPPASSSPAAASFRTQGESASSYIRSRPFSRRDDEDSKARRNVNRLAESLLSNDDVFQNNAARAGAMPPPLHPPLRPHRGGGKSDDVQTQPKRRRLNRKNDDQPISTNTTSYRDRGSRGTSTSRQSRNNSTSQGPPVTTFPSLQISNLLAAANFIDSGAAPVNSRPPQQEQLHQQQHQQQYQLHQQYQPHQHYQPHQQYQPHQHHQHHPHQHQQQKEQNQQQN